MAREGDEPAFEELTALHLRELHLHCYRMLGSIDDADDLLQETLAAAWRGLPALAGRSSSRSWLYAHRDQSLPQRHPAFQAPAARAAGATI